MAAFPFLSRRFLAAVIAVSGLSLLILAPLAFKRAGLDPRLAVAVLGPFAVGQIQMGVRMWRRRAGIAEGVITAGFDLTMYGALILLGAAIVAATHAEHSVKKGLIVATACLIAGGVLFAFRLKRRVLYGISEVLVGAYLAYSKGVGAPDRWSDITSDPTFVAAVVTASVYLIVRGCDNVHVGVKAIQAAREAQERGG